jgi:hypothetical protein
MQDPKWEWYRKRWGEKRREEEGKLTEEKMKGKL